MIDDITPSHRPSRSTRARRRPSPLGKRHWLSRFGSAALGLALFAAVSEQGALAQASNADNREFFISTATTGGAYHQGGVSLSALVKIKLLPEYKIDLTTRNSSGSLENMARLESGSTEFAIVQGLLGHHARKGTGPANRLGKQPELRAVTMLWPNVEHFIVRRDAAPTGSINDLSALTGKRMSFGREASAIESNRFLLQNLGLNISRDFDQVYLSFNASAEAFRDGSVDGLSLPASTPVPAFLELLETLGPDATVLQWSPDLLRRANGGLGLWSQVTVPAGIYPNQTGPISTIGQPNFLAVRADVDEDVVYQMTKTIFENLPFLQRLHKPFQFLSPETALDGLPVPLHPGALRYFQEIRLDMGQTFFASNEYEVFGKEGASVDQIRQAAQQGVVSFMIPEDGTSDQLAAELVDAMADVDDLRVLPLKGKGTAHNLADLLYLKGVDIGVLQLDALEFARQQNVVPNLTDEIRYITKWHDLEVHLLVRDDILNIEQLSGEPVNFGPRGSGSEVTAANLFNENRVLVDQTSYPHQEALDKLKAGEIAGMVYVAGKPVPLFEKIQVRDGLRLLSLPGLEEADESQVATLTEKDYPTLVFGSRTIRTKAIPSVLAAYNWPADSDRFAPISQFVDQLLANLGELQQGNRHPKWQEIDPNVELEVWQPHQALEARLQESRLANTQIGQGGPLQSPADTDSLDGAREAVEALKELIKPAPPKPKPAIRRSPRQPVF